MKYCNGCKTEKKRELFSKDKSKSDGKKTLCKECVSDRDDGYSESRKKYYLENQTKNKKDQKEYYEKNKEKISERMKKYGKLDRVRESQKIHNAKRRALKISTEDGSITKQSLQELRELQNNKCY